VIYDEQLVLNLQNTIGKPDDKPGLELGQKPQNYSANSKDEGGSDQAAIILSFFLHSLAITSKTACRRNPQYRLRLYPPLRTILHPINPSEIILNSSHH